jgi:hypothetical protein
MSTRSLEVETEGHLKDFIIIFVFIGCFAMFNVFSPDARILFARKIKGRARAE